MKKLWRSGMIDKKVLREREQAEYVNRLERTILELRRKPPEPEPSNVILEFGEGQIICAPRGSLKDIMHYESHSYNRKTTRENINDWLFEQLRNHPRYDSDIEYDKTLNENRKAKGFKEV
jgi:hypothetical protein